MESDSSPKKKFRIELPLPPPVNNLFPSGKSGRRYKSKRYRAWINAADTFYLLQKRSITPLTGQYVMTISLPAKLRGDASNYIKAPEDYCVSRGLTADDAKSQAVSAQRVAGLTCCVVEAWEV